MNLLTKPVLLVQKVARACLVQIYTNHGPRRGEREGVFVLLAFARGDGAASVCGSLPTGGVKKAREAFQRKEWAKMHKQGCFILCMA